MADNSRLYALIADALSDAARAHERAAQAFARLASAEGGDKHPTPEPLPMGGATVRRVAPPVIPLGSDDEDDDEGTELKPTSLRILSALAGAVDPLTRSRICVRAGITTKSSATDRSLAELRAGGFILTEGHVNAITELGASVSRPELPTGYQLFAYWVEELGGHEAPPARILLALRDAIRDGKRELDRAGICSRAGLTIKSSTTDRAFAKVRRLELVQTTGQLNALHIDLQEALTPTINVHNTTTGKSYRVKAQ